MGYQTHITKIAEYDLIKIIDYIDHVLKNRTAADNLLVEIEKKIISLESNPKIYPIVQDTILASWGIRLLVVNNYFVFYKVDQKQKLIFIIRIMYKKRNWISILHQGIDLE